jgi:hypothetical protein
VAFGLLLASLAVVVFLVASLSAWFVSALQGEWVPILGVVFVIALGVALVSFCILLLRRIGPPSE